MTKGLVYLINAGNDPCLTSIANDSTFPALGVISIGTAVKNYKPNWALRVFDGQVMPKDYIVEEMRREQPHAVGVSVLSTSYENAIDYARAAKNSGAVVIFGNDQPALLGRNMMSKREEIDYICTSDIGELTFIAFLDFLDGNRSLEQVPNLLYRGKVIHSTDESPLADIAKGDLKYGPKDKWAALDITGIPDRKLLPAEAWNVYLGNYLSKYAWAHKHRVTGVTTINRARGCARVKEPCSYCGIKDLALRFSSPEMFWADVKAGISDIKANIFYEVFDSMSSAPQWVRRLISARPKDIEDVHFFVYTQALETTKLLVDLYKELGVFRANMGLDSGDDVMLKRLKGPKDSVEQNKKAAILLKDAGIQIYGSLVLGAPGENHKSLENTINFARWLVDNRLVAGIEAQPLYPEFNAKAGRWLMNPDEAKKVAEKLGFKIKDEKLLYRMKDKWEASENPDPDEISRDWAQIFCEVSYDDLVKASKEINEYAEKHGISGGSAWIKNT